MENDPDKKGTDLPPIFVNSIPKSGTNLLTRCLDLLGYHDLNTTPFRTRCYQQLIDVIGMGRPWSIHHGSLHRHLRLMAPPSDERAIPVGLRSTTTIPSPLLERWLNQLQSGDYMSGHIPYSENLADLLRSLNLKQIVILRNPADVIQSRLKYELNWSEIRYDSVTIRMLFRTMRRLINQLPFLDTSLERELRERTRKEQLHLLLNGGRSREGNRLPGMKEQYEQVLPWTGVENTKVLLFRHLMGPAGGGNRTDQLQTITDLCNFLDVPINEHTRKHVADNVFDPTSKTFRRGSTASAPSRHPDVFTADMQETLNKINRMLQDHGLVSE